MRTFGRKIRCGRPAAAAALILALLLLPALPRALAAQSDKVKYELSLLNGGRQGLKVTVSFNARQGERVTLAPEVEAGPGSDPAYRPEIQVDPPAGPGYTVETSAAPGGGWTVTAGSSGEISVPYTVGFPGLNASQKDSQARGAQFPPPAIITKDLKVIRCSEALMCPRRAGGEPVSSGFVVDLPVASGENALVPWQELDGGSFSVSGLSSLMGNYMVWGKLETVRSKARGVGITTGYAGGVTLSESERRSYDQGLVSLYNYIAEKVGERPRLDRVTVLVCGARTCGLSSPAYETGLSSVVLFADGSALTGTGAGAAAGGLFGLWNGYSLLPSKDGDAAWFQEGVQAFYPLRVAALTGLMDSKEAFTEFSEVYRSYLTDPLAGKVSLVEAEGRADAAALLRKKGSSVVASLSRRLQDEAKGSVKDIDWLLGTLARKFDHFAGKDYSLVDISETLEGATGKSWDRFFAGKVAAEQPVLTSEFSQSDMFGSTSFAGGVVSGKGSGRNWLYLVIAIVVILLIPVIFSTYVRRAVKLDVTMPKILPDDDD